MPHKLRVAQVVLGIFGWVSRQGPAWTYMMRMMKKQLLNWFVPPELQDNSVTQRQACRAVVFGLAMVFWAPVFAPIYLLLGSTRGCAMITIVAAAILVSIASLRFTKSVRLTGHLIAGSVFAVLLGLATVTGGTGSPALWWLPAVPIIGLILCGVPSGMAWAGMSCLACLGFLLLDQWGVTLAEELGPSQMRLLNWAATSGIILCAFSLTLAFKLGEDAARLDLETARLASEQANKVKSAFLANMSHEIRTPMSAILGMSRMLIETDLTRTQREYLSTIVDSGESLLTIINDILDLSRIEADKIQIEQVPFSLEDNLFDALRSLAVKANEKGLELIGDIGPTAPLVVGDPVRLRQILTNLVGNAIKFTEAGEVVVTVTTAEISDDRTVVNFVVSDTGIGIPEDRLSRVFDPFEQADTTTTRKFGGTGLGLAIVSRLARLMGGDVQVQSVVGEGSRFHVRLPFEVTPERPSPIPGRTPRHFQGVRVLVVDDHPTCRDVLDRTLRHWGMVPTVVASGQQALEEFQTGAQGPPRVRRFAGRLGNARHEWPAIRAGSLPRRAMRPPARRDARASEKGLKIFPGANGLGVAACLSKPVKPSGLLDAVCAALQGPAAPTVPVPPGVEPPTPSTLLHILLAEDSLVNQKLTVALLRKRGHKVVIANNGKEAVSAAREQQFDLILMDIQMPEMDGYDATAAIRAHEHTRGCHTPIIALTAHAMTGDRERCLQAGMDEYITKPVRAEQLFDTMALVLKGPGSGGPTRDRRGRSTGRHHRLAACPVRPGQRSATVEDVPGCGHRGVARPAGVRPAGSSGGRWGQSSNRGTYPHGYHPLPWRRRRHEHGL